MSYVRRDLQPSKKLDLKNTLIFCAAIWLSGQFTRSFFSLLNIELKETLYIPKIKLCFKIHLCNIRISIFKISMIFSSLLHRWHFFVSCDVIGGWSYIEIAWALPPGVTVLVPINCYWLLKNKWHDTWRRRTCNFSIRPTRPPVTSHETQKPPRYLTFLYRYLDF
jgi:hypothetical protein